MQYVLGHVHFNFWSMRNIELIVEKFNLNIIEQYQYISEEAILNYLNFKPNYNSVSTDIDWLMSNEKIIENNLGYKHVLILQKP